MLRTVLIVALVGCGGGDSQSPSDASGDAPGDSTALPDTCTGACATTAVTATFQATRQLDHAYYGVTASDGTLHVEVHAGGTVGCPTMSSPTPDYSLILGAVPPPSTTAPTTSPGNILDFQGDLLGGPLGAMATTVAITPVAAAADDFLAIDIDLAFANGTASGHVFATYCTSLDSP